MAANGENMVAIERPAPGASSKLIRLEGAPFWVLVVYMGFLRFLQIGLYGAIVIKVGGAYLTAVNGITSWTAFGGWRLAGGGSGRPVGRDHLHRRLFRLVLRQAGQGHGR
jgi:hypothetical protein